MWREEECKAVVDEEKSAILLKWTIHKAGKITRCWGKQRALEQCQRTILLQERLEKAQILLQQDPQSAAAQDDYQQASSDL
jgi:hypothetical protein